MTPSDRRLLWQHMRRPILAFTALVTLLAANLLLGALHPFGKVWIAECAIMACMVLVVLLVSMVVLRVDRIMVVL